MKTKLALLVIYNHRYDKNIPLVEKIYKNRFSHIFHLVPFYDGEKDNVITVYENSFYFQNYVSQAFQHLKSLKFTHFFVIADDMILNPILDENNLWDELDLCFDECFLPGFLVLQKRKSYWPHAKEALNYTLKVKGVEVMNILPEYKDAIKRFEKYGLPVTNLNKDVILKKDKSKLKNLLKSVLFSIQKKNRKLEYPLVGGYSDIFLVTANVMPKFALFCGAFSATKLFVELAIPTAMVLSSDKIKVGNNMRLQGEALWDKNEISDIENKYNFHLNELLDGFPKGKLFLHPIKLSKWLYRDLT